MKHDQTPEREGTWGKAQTGIRGWDLSALLWELRETSAVLPVYKQGPMGS